MKASKVRPAVCLTDPVGPHRHVVVAFVSSHRLVTLTTSLIRRDLGKLSQAWNEEVDQKLAILFGLNQSHR